MVLLQVAVKSGLGMTVIVFLMFMTSVPVIAVLAFSKLKAPKEEGNTKGESFTDNVMTALGSIIFAVMIFLLIVFIISLFIPSSD